ncbi:MAG: DUF4386 domain-containing protein [Candidatus Hodarchaeales archaeon]|jgi:hypothetical protein
MASETVVMNLIGFLYLFILGTNAASVGLGNRIDEREEDAENRLQIINENPERFKLSIVIALISHISIFIIAGVLFLSFSQYDQSLAFIGTIFRFGEGVILVYNEIKFLTLLNLAKEYIIAGDVEQRALSTSKMILQKKSYQVMLAFNFLAISTLLYSILFLSSGAIPLPIGWLAFTASVLSVIGTSIVLAKPKLRQFASVFILLMLFELTFGVWLILS